MCAAVVLLGDMATEHDGFHPSPVIEASPDVFMDGKPVARQGDAIAAHGKSGEEAHPRTITGGVSTVLVNGRPIAVTGSAVDCGGIVIGSGSGQVG
ncbi:type VI secretion system PAAR protein [Aeromonas sp.]|uniref:type VI secretion system PAAR protein n=1 Tax=Aeromonas sp. TaxID=647 RepID=UPI002583E2EC|nr:type VI secretion system PAAR protein [Aeromonas sp.]MCX7132118.1 type VI secretion system PAAR protein [Aeromonas sp.]